MIDPLRSISPRATAMAAFLLWVPISTSFVLDPNAWWVDYAGIALHLAMFILVAKLDAPDWAKAAGYGWVVLDVMTGVLTLNDVPASIALYVRLSGHIFAGIWFAGASLQGTRTIKIVGCLLGAWLGGYTIVASFVPIAALGPASALTALWTALVAWNNGVGEASGEAAARPCAP